MANLSSMDALGRWALTKINSSSAMPANAVQLLVANGTLSTAGVFTLDMWNPTSIDVHVHPTVTATLAISHSFDGVNWVHDTSNDIAMTADTAKIVNIKGARYIQLVPSVAQSSGFILTVSAKY